MKWYESSSGSGLSLTIGGLAIGGFLPVIVLVFSLFGADVTQTEISEIISTMIASISSAMTVIGLVRKLYYKVVVK